MKYNVWEAKLHNALNVKFTDQNLWIAKSPKARFTEVLALINKQYRRCSASAKWMPR